MYIERSLSKTLDGAQRDSYMSKLYSIEGVIEKTSDHLHRLLPILNTQPGVPEFNCGILVVAKDETPVPIPLIMMPFGNVPNGSLEEYSKPTWGKVIVLHNFTGLVSSQDVPDYNPGRFTGAIRAGGYILAFGGLKGFYDELLMVILAIDLGLIEKKDAVKKILKPNKSLLAYTEYMKVWRKSPGRGKRTRA